MKERDLYRLVGMAALACAIVAGVIHLLAVVGSPPASGLTIVLWTLPVLAVTALVYIVAVHRSPASLRSPAWAIVCWTAVAAYGAINFSLERRATEGGDVKVVDAHRVLVVHGRTVRALSSADARTVANWKLRGISGHLLPLFILPGIGLLILAPRVRTAGRTTHVA